MASKLTASKLTASKPMASRRTASQHTVSRHTVSPCTARRCTPPSAGKDFSYIQICSFVAIGVSVFSWLLFYVFLSIPAMIGAIILNVKAKREGAPQNIVTISKIAMIVTIVMASLQLLFVILFVALGLSGNL